MSPRKRTRRPKSVKQPISTFDASPVPHHAGYRRLDLTASLGRRLSN